MWWMIGTAVLLLPFLRSGLRVSRLEGVVLGGVYAVYLVTLLGQ
jgi:Ca2+/Na+ antiporter